MDRISDLDTLKDAKPFLRSILAFLVYLRYASPYDTCYAKADSFIAQLEADLEKDK